ncbi:MAG: hypothetical protein ACI9F9_001696 [Candidatus Paceibacteria bacterium]|jgi:hypothetical protein
MEWSDLGSQFCLQLAFGTLLALAFVPKAPVGVLFYRVMGGAALIPIVVAAVLPVINGGLEWTEPSVLATAAGLLAVPFYAGKSRGLVWAMALGFGLVSCTVALALILERSLEVEGAGNLALVTLSALATGAVAGSVGLAMVLGHWYLTVPKLKVSHLGRLNRVTMGAMLVSLLLVGVSCAVFYDTLEYADTPLFGARGLFNIGTRLVVGLLVPLLFAWMAKESMRYGNTRSATGILYASTVMVLIGTALSINLQDVYGLPL